MGLCVWGLPWWTHGIPVDSASPKATAFSTVIRTLITVDKYAYSLRQPPITSWWGLSSTVFRTLSVRTRRRHRFFTRLIEPVARETSALTKQTGTQCPASSASSTSSASSSACRRVRTFFIICEAMLFLSPGTKEASASTSHDCSANSSSDPIRPIRSMFTGHPACHDDHDVIRHVQGMAMKTGGTPAWATARAREGQRNACLHRWQSKHRSSPHFILAVQE